jgi:hypothetical protein
MRPVSGQAGWTRGGARSGPSVSRGGLCARTSDGAAVDQLAAGAGEVTAPTAGTAINAGTWSGSGGADTNRSDTACWPASQPSISTWSADASAVP